MRLRHCQHHASRDAPLDPRALVEFMRRGAPPERPRGSHLEALSLDALIGNPDETRVPPSQPEPPSAMNATADTAMSPSAVGSPKPWLRRTKNDTMNPATTPTFSARWRTPVRKATVRPGMASRSSRPNMA